MTSVYLLIALWILIAVNFYMLFTNCRLFNRLKGQRDELQSLLTTGKEFSEMLRHNAAELQFMVDNLDDLDLFDSDRPNQKPH